MGIVDYTLFLVKSIVSDSELVSAKEIGSDEDNTIIEVLIKESDMSRVIGKNGRNIESIRTLVQAYSYLHDKKKVKININSF